MTPPTTYAQWSECLDLFEAGLDDATCAEAMRAGKLEWTNGVATNFTRRIDDTLRVRLSRCGDRLSRNLSSSREEATLLRALLDCRRALGVLRQVAQSEAFPAELRTHLASQVHDFAQRTQSSIEDSARGDATGRLASLLRHNSLMRFESTAPTSDAPSVDAVPSGPRRRTFLTGPTA